MRVTIFFGEGGLGTCAQCHQQQLHVEHMMGQEIHHIPYHIPIVRSQLTRSLGDLYLEISDEITTAFDDVLDLRGNGEHVIPSFPCAIHEELEHSEWKSVPALSSTQKIVCRTTNRVFVGLPLCVPPPLHFVFISCVLGRDPEWIDLNIQYTIDIMKGGAVLGLFPNFLKP